MIKFKFIIFFNLSNSTSQWQKWKKLCSKHHTISSNDSRKHIFAVPFKIRTNSIPTTSKQFNTILNFPFLRQFVRTIPNCVKSPPNCQFQFRIDYKSLLTAQLPEILFNPSIAEILFNPSQLHNCQKFYSIRQAQIGSTRLKFNQLLSIEI